MKEPKIIAEIGCNHKGDMNIAKEMIKIAATYCNADIVKFQKRCNRELLTPEEYNAPHPNPNNSYGKTYGEHREFLEFNLEQHRQQGVRHRVLHFCMGCHICKRDMHAESEINQSAVSLQPQQKNA